MMTQNIICNNSWVNGAHTLQQTNNNSYHNHNYYNHNSVNYGNTNFTESNNNNDNNLKGNKNKNHWRVITFRVFPTPCMEYLQYPTNASQTDNNTSSTNESAANNKNHTGYYHKIITEYRKFGKLSPEELGEFRRACTVVLENVCTCTTDFELRSILNLFGEVRKVRVTRPQGREYNPTAFYKCFALYESKESADLCKQYLNGAEFYGMRLIVNPPRKATVSSHQSDYDEEQHRPCTFGTNGPRYISEEVYRLMSRIGIDDITYNIYGANVKDYQENEDINDNYTENIDVYNPYQQ